jgi:hypothetical protein
MVKKFALVFAIFALIVATAGTVPTPGSTYKITLLQPSVVNGAPLKAGEYRLTVGAEKITIASSKQTVEAPVKVETVERKFDTTAIRYVEQAGNQVIAEIRIGGTKTKLVLNP